MPLRTITAVASLIHEPERPRKPWRVDWTERGGRRTSKRFRTEREAGAWITSLERGAAASQARMRLDDWVEQWMRSHGPEWASKTLSERAWYAQSHISPGLGRVRIGEITRPDVRNWRAAMLSQGTPPKVINAAVRILSACLGAAVNNDILAANPCQGLRPLPVPPVDREPATLDEVEGIHQEMRQPADRVVTSLIAYAGLRPGEVRSLRWRDVRPTALFVLRAADAAGRTKTTKSGSTRTVPIIGALQDDLDELPRGRPDDLVVGRAVDWDNWTMRVWRPARLLAECAPAPYALRHTFASLLIAEGRTVFEVAALLGHSTPNLTMSTYGHLFAEAQIAPDQDMSEAAHAARQRAPQRAAERAERRDRVADALPGTAAELAAATGLDGRTLAVTLDVLVRTRRAESDGGKVPVFRVPQGRGQRDASMRAAS